MKKTILYKNKLKMKTWILFQLLVFLFLSGNLLAQNGHVPTDNRGETNSRRNSNMNGNNVRTTVHNFGWSGTLGSTGDQWAYEWPKNTGRIHVALVAIWLGGEVKDETGETIQVVEFPALRTNSEGGSWNLEPVPGFLNPDKQEIARSDMKETWPQEGIWGTGWRDKLDDPVDPGWVGSWNGFFGKNVFNADQEMFYRCSDDNYDKHNYFPDTTDYTRSGLGFLMDVRSLAWSQILVNDVLFYIHDIKNDGTKRVSKTSFLIWLADLVGGDSQDDEPFVDLQNNIAFLTDADRIGGEAWDGEAVGLASVKFLETPGNQVDGIDNDGDADSWENRGVFDSITVDPEVYLPQFAIEDFESRSLSPGDTIVLIDSLTYERRVILYPTNDSIVYSMGKQFNLLSSGITIQENTIPNLFDDDLDGLIDEADSLHRLRFNEVTETVQSVRYINYLAFSPGDTIKRGFIHPGKNTPATYSTVAPMIDESRDDGFDNDNDWDVLNDDLGYDGVENTGDFGEMDGLPSSGSGTNFPGEPNIDKTDVSETDLIGITSALQDPAFAISFGNVRDNFIWNKFMKPGYFNIQRLTGEYDTYVSSGYFPVEPGERQRMAISVAMAGGGNSPSLQADLESAIQKQKQARTAYESDYRFAQAPNQVTMKAVPGNGKVTLYWDDIAEESEDLFVKRLGGDYKDFEGYRIYRATDAAFKDAKIITDNMGTPTLLQPLAQFDLEDGIVGNHPVDINGVMFPLGEDTGILHSFVDSTVINGQRYFYAVTAYDFGYAQGNIPPTETPIKIDVSTGGNIEFGINVAVVVPRAPAAGYLPADVVALEHTHGTTSGVVGYEIIDPEVIKDGHEYEITFADTIVESGQYTTVTTKHFTLADVTTDDPDTLLRECTRFEAGDEVPFAEGFRLNFINEGEIALNTDLSKWNNNDIFNFSFAPVVYVSVYGQKQPYDYEIVFSDTAGYSTSKDTTIWMPFNPISAKDVNFKIYKVSEDSREEVEFAFSENHGDDGFLSIDTANSDYVDVVYILDKNIENKLVYSWMFILEPLPLGSRMPAGGDTLRVFTRKPFTSADVFNFSVKESMVSKSLAKKQLDKIRVVPNPYVAAVQWEPRNTYSSGRGSRLLQFINLPPKCTIRIFDVSGLLVDQIEHNSGINDGTERWDMLSRDNMELSYGIYIYHISAPGIGEKTGRFALIK